MSERVGGVPVDGEQRGSALPGSDGEHRLQDRFETVDRADRFYESAVQRALTGPMRSFLRERRIALVGSADDHLTPSIEQTFDESGPIRVVDETTVSWPAGGDHGMFSTALNVRSNPHATVTVVDWWDSTVGLHVNGAATVRRDPPVDDDGAGDADEWIVLDVEEAYIHCAKHIPKLRVVEAEDRDVARSVAASDGAPAGAGGGQRGEGRSVFGRLDDRLQRFVASRILAFLGTVDSGGETDVSPRFGPRGFVQVIDGSTLAWPEFRGNGIHASLGNVMETGTATLLFVDWWQSDTVVRVAGDARLHDSVPGAVDLTDTEKTKTWVVLDVEEVAVEERGGMPTLDVEEFDPPWGTDDEEAKKVGFFDG